MQLQTCSTENSILEADLGNAVLQRTLDKLKVMETDDGFYVVVQVRWAGDKDWYLNSAMAVVKNAYRLRPHCQYSAEKYCWTRMPQPKKKPCTSRQENSAEVKQWPILR